jgi:hypothetical protein
MSFEPLQPIKNIAFKAMQDDNPHKHKKALQDILWYIAKEEENFRLRIQYYENLH